MKTTYLIPLSIIIAGAFIGGGLALGLSRLNVGVQTKGVLDSDKEPSQSPPQVTIRPITKEDHIRGDFDAPLTLVEYADTECPFCKRFHPTLKQILRDYEGKVRWVYRHFPLTQIHPKAPKEAHALECAGEQGKFWEYTDRLYEITPSNNNLDLAQLPAIAESVGLDVEKFNECMESNRYEAHVQEDLQDAINAGSKGTPNTILIDVKGEKTQIQGAQPYENVKAIIDSKL